LGTAVITASGCSAVAKHKFPYKYSGHLNTQAIHVLKIDIPVLKSSNFQMKNIIFVFLLFFPSQLLAESFGPLEGFRWGGGTKNIVVIIHGDGGPGRYDSFAGALASRYKNSTIITLLRPGYKQGKLRSKGTGGYSVGDQYTKKNNRLVAEALQAIKGNLKARKLIVIGHSGGAAQLGTIIGRFPGIVDTALLVSCPCDVPNWRISRRGKNKWLKSQSPDKFISGIPLSTKVYVVIGERDANTRFRFSKKYVEKSAALGKSNVVLTPIPGGTHSWSTLEPTVGKILAQEMR